MQRAAKLIIFLENLECSRVMAISDCFGLSRQVYLIQFDDRYRLVDLFSAGGLLSGGM